MQLPAPSQKSVKSLRIWPGKFLTFMEATRLKANPSKTSFIMFGSQNELPFQVGTTMVEESKDIEFLGINFTKRLTWKKQLDRMEGELRKRIGVLYRPAWHLPRKIVIDMINPIFTSKLRYALELLVDTSKPNQDMAIHRFHSLHRLAMKASLGINRLKEISDQALWDQTGQKSVIHIANVAIARLAWKCSKNWHEHPLTRNLIEEHTNARPIRQNLRVFLPQKVKGSIIHSLVETWEQLPKEIRQEEKMLTKSSQ